MPARPIKIVIVNDEPIALEFFSGIIRPAFHRAAVVCFENALLALADLLFTPPNLLITDDKMPAFTGEQLCRVLDERNVCYPILVDSVWKPTQEWVKELASRVKRFVVVRAASPGKYFADDRKCPEH